MGKQIQTVEYGGVQLDVLNHTGSYVPQFSSPIKVSQDTEKALAIAVKNNLPALLIGETGTGKTSIVRELAYMRKQGYVRINMNGGTTADELIGSKSVKNGQTYYEDGVLTRAMKNGYMLVLDEINATPPDCTFVIHGLLDDDRMVTLPNGDVVRPHKDFRVFATMNPDYEGTRSLNRAFLDRFAVILNFDIPTPAKEMEILAEKGKVEKDTAEKMVTLAHSARQAYREQKTLTFVSTRSLLQWANLMITGKMDPKVAYIAAIANKARPEEKPAFLDFYAAVFKTTPEEEADAITLIPKRNLDAYELQIRKLRDELRTSSNRVAQLEQIQPAVEQFKKERDAALQEVAKVKKAAADLFGQNPEVILSQLPKKQAEKLAKSKETAPSETASEASAPVTENQVTEVNTSDGKVVEVQPAETV